MARAGDSDRCDSCNGSGACPRLGPDACDLPSFLAHPILHPLQTVSRWFVFDNNRSRWLHDPEDLLSKAEGEGSFKQLSVSIRKNQNVQLIPKHGTVSEALQQADTRCTRFSGLLRVLATYTHNHVSQPQLCVYVHCPGDQPRANRQVCKTQFLMHLPHSYQKSQIQNKHAEKDWHDWLQ